MLRSFLALLLLCLLVTPALAEELSQIEKDALEDLELAISDEVNQVQPARKGAVYRMYVNRYKNERLSIVISEGMMYPSFRGYNTTYVIPLELIDTGRLTVNANEGSKRWYLPLVLEGEVLEIQKLVTGQHMYPLPKPTATMVESFTLTFRSAETAASAQQALWTLIDEAQRPE